MSTKSREEARKLRQRRVRAKVHGNQERPRLNVFRSLNHIYVQVIDDETGQTLVAVSTAEQALKSALAGKKKTEQAQAIGTAVAERAKAKGITQVVFDRGGYKYHGRVKALADAARAAGLEF
jgi:large subunit ribosomal protein L18